MGVVIQIRPEEHVPKVKHDLNREARFLSDCYQDGWAPIFCPSGGMMLGGMIPMTTEWFECGVCKARWRCENFEELFDSAYPRGRYEAK